MFFPLPSASSSFIRPVGLAVVMAAVMATFSHAAPDPHVAPAPQEALTLDYTPMWCTTGHAIEPHEPIVHGASHAATFAVVNSHLPADLHLNGATGVISGTPTNAGNHRFYVRITDGQRTSTTLVVCTVRNN